MPKSWLLQSSITYITAVVHIAPMYRQQFWHLVLLYGCCLAMSHPEHISNGVMWISAICTGLIYFLMLYYSLQPTSGIQCSVFGLFMSIYRTECWKKSHLQPIFSRNEPDFHRQTLGPGAWGGVGGRDSKALWLVNAISCFKQLLENI